VALTSLMPGDDALYLEGQRGDRGFWGCGPLGHTFRGLPFDGSLRLTAHRGGGVLLRVKFAGPGHVGASFQGQDVHAVNVVGMR
jgi:hypothetical protein